MSSDRDSGDIAGALVAYEKAPAMMLACEGDDMVLASANEAARAVLGERCLFGRPVREMAPRVVDQLTLQFGDDLVETVYATGRSVTRPACRVEMQAQDQEMFEVFWDVTVSPWFADDGSVRGVLAHGVDVTEKTRARRRRRRRASLDDVIALQDALLPQWLPVLPGVEIAGRYLLAQAEEAAGGDWYDAVGLDRGRVALMVGDVVGHGASAAAVMGQLRAVLQERLIGGDDLHGAMLALDQFASQHPDASATTLCVVVLDTGSGRFEYCTAGHPPPLVVRPDVGLSRYLPHSGAAPLATTGEMTIAEDHVDCGDLVILYTDGIMARPGRSLANTTVELGQVAVDAATVESGSVGPADLVCERALELATGRTGYADDIAVLVAEVTEPPDRLHLDLPADEEAAFLVLEACAEWLESLRVRDLDHIVVQHAVDELVRNVMEHAYDGPPDGDEGRVTVDAALLASGDLRISFADAGRWSPPRSEPSFGRGLSMVRGMVDRLVLTTDEGGTVATIEHRLSRPARMLTGVTTAEGRRAAPRRDQPFAVTGEGASLRCVGRLDAAHVDDLRGALVDVAGLERVTIDLSGVSLLSSAAVQALHAARRAAADRGQQLNLHASAGTTAQHVLELVRLPYSMSDRS